MEGPHDGRDDRKPQHHQDTEPPRSRHPQPGRRPPAQRPPPPPAQRDRADPHTLAAPGESDLSALDPVQIRSLIADVLTQHGYDVLDRSPYDPELNRHRDARRAVRRAYGPRFLDAPEEQAVLADPLREVLAGGRRTS
ncbi:hypothetical protein OG285_25040 [Streptomyces sp. NBC_01471]